ncbi:hypothetical protein AX15_005518 [Amanita polypyramis BW_CC]|nr:hypothetical protein AX15_005518 [Amanita polypyramis BW_CC]
MSNSPKSECNDYDFPELSQEDFAQLDAIAAAYFNLPAHQGGPQVRVELEGTIQVHETTPSTSANTPPMQTFRRNHVLSVTDLVSPAWCEVQFDYGLRQRRSRPLEMRPDSFLSASGKEIPVEKKIAVQNDHITKRGRAVHKELEKELGLKEIQVFVTSPEERWALRMLNFVTGIEGILTNGYTRELPVFGIVHDQIIVGVIDEVKHCSTFSMNKSNLHDSPSSDKSRTLINNYSRPPDIPECKTPKKHICVLQLLDTKTRRTDSLPSAEDTLSSRLQLMLYYRLLSDLLSEYPPLNYSLLWDKLGLKPTRPFSAQFLVDAGLIVDNTEEKINCLEDVVYLLYRTVQKLDVTGIDAELQIVYRLQPKNVKRKVEKRKTSEVDAVPASLISQEERELSLALEASLKDIQRRQNGEPEDGPQSLQQSNFSNAGRSSVDPESDDSPSSSAYATPPDQIPSDDTYSATAIVSDAEDSKIIGSKEFYYNENFLDTYISEVLQWWYGYRKPKGVPVHLSRRCFSCEYYAGCEWREEKGMEITKNALRKNAPEPEESNY